MSDHNEALPLKGFKDCRREILMKEAQKAVTHTTKKEFSVVSRTS